MLTGHSLPHKLLPALPLVGDSLLSSARVFGGADGPYRPSHGDGPYRGHGGPCGVFYDDVAWS